MFLRGSGNCCKPEEWKELVRQRAGDKESFLDKGASKSANPDVERA